MSKDKKATGEWGAFLQGVMLALWFYVVCMFVLALVFVKGVLPERVEMVAVAGVGFVSAMVGGIVSSNRSSLAKFSASMISTAVFAVVLAVVGAIGWGKVFWSGNAVVLMACVLAGGIAAALRSGGKKKRGKRRGKTRVFAK